MARRYAFDSLMQLSDGAAAYTADGIGQVDAADAILDLGGSPINTNFAVLDLVGALARIDAMCVIDVSAIVVGTDDDVYDISIMGSNNDDGSDPVNLATMTLGYGTLIPNGAHSSGGAAAGTGSDTSPGRFELPFTNEQNGIIYEWVYLYVTVAGTDKSITFTAYVAVLPKI